MKTTTRPARFLRTDFTSGIVAGISVSTVREGRGFATAVIVGGVVSDSIRTSRKADAGETHNDICEALCGRRPGTTTADLVARLWADCVSAPVLAVAS